VDTIGLVKVHLVGCLPAKCVVGHLGIVLFDVKVDELPELLALVDLTLTWRCEIK
jgi:hypothetical protein